MDPVPSLQSKVLSLPPGFDIVNGHIGAVAKFNNRCREEPQDSHVYCEESGFIALDIAVLPPKSVGDLIKEKLNTPIVEKAGSFTFDDSHYPHMTLVHTLISPQDLPLACSILSTLAHNVPAAIVDYLWKRATRVAATTDLRALRQFRESSLAQNDCGGKKVVVPMDFLSAGPYWHGDDHLPYIALRNPEIPAYTDIFPGEIPETLHIAEEMCRQIIQSLSPQQLLRCLHEALCFALMPLRKQPFADEWPAGSDAGEGLPFELVQECDGKGSEALLAARARGRHAVLREQGCWYTGGPLVPAITTVIEHVRVCARDGDGNSSSTEEDLVVVKAADAQHTLEHTDTATNVYAPACGVPHAAVEMVSPGTMSYSTNFDTIGRADKYNPHITVGSGPADIVFECLSEAAVEIGGGKKVDRGNSEFYPSIPLEASVPMELGTVVMFQLGNNGACRFPMYKDELMW